MKNYKECKKVSIGCSDMGHLVLNFPQGVQRLCFDEDGAYSAYVVEDEKIIIPEHYKKQVSCTSWLRVYDDTGLAVKFEGARIEVYTAGNFGCIVRLIK
ncbi:MAG: hypothetical protein J6D26_04135 [Clostridia bacterium]|nr:hypothetical protein [Clostridia bacterium]